MTLAAAILLLSFSSLTFTLRGFTPQSTNLSTQTSPAQSSANPEQTQTPSPPATAKTNSGQPQSSKTSASKASTGKRTRRKKKPTTSDCDPATSNTGNAGSAPTTTSPATEGSQSPATEQGAKPCPPAKVVVRKGGITEQSIQLAGGSAGADDATQKRDAANRMLAATEDNLKKMDGQQLTTAQQESAAQIRQFVKQSKSFLATGDLERAQTLAWKAKLLSDDLVNPGK